MLIVPIGIFCQKAFNAHKVLTTTMCVGRTTAKPFLLRGVEPIKAQWVKLDNSQKRRKNILYVYCKHNSHHDYQNTLMLAVHLR